MALGALRRIAAAALLALSACGGRALIEDGPAPGGQAGALGIGGGGAGGAGGAELCGAECPSPFLGIQLAVISSAGPGEVAGVEAELFGPGGVVVRLSCSGFAQTTHCLPTEGGPEGSYKLQVTAPDFAPVTADATVTFTPASGCGCGVANVQPAVVILNPQR